MKPSTPADRFVCLPLNSPPPSSDHLVLWKWCFRASQQPPRNKSLAEIQEEQERQLRLEKQKVQQQHQHQAKVCSLLLLTSSCQEPASVRGEGLWVMYLSCPLALELDVNWMLLLMSVSHLEALAVALCMPSHIDRCIPQVERTVCVIFFFYPPHGQPHSVFRG